MTPVQRWIRSTLRRLMSLVTSLCVLLALIAAISVAASTTAFADATPVLKAADWFGGNGASVCSNDNGGGSETTCGGEMHVGGVSGAWWQCVEFVQRFYKQQGWYSGIFPGVSVAADIYSQADGGHLGTMTAQANGSITSLVPGDMIVHGAADKYSPKAGHVAIVDHLSPDGKTVYAVQQNAPANAIYGFDGSTLTGGSGNDILGIVHSPKNTNTASGSPTPPPSPFKPSYVASATNTDGTLEVFAVGTDKNIYVDQESAPNSDSWGSWGELNAGANSVATARMADGRLMVFYVGGDGGIYYRFQASPGSGSWSNEEHIAANLAGPISASVNANGTIELFAVGTDKNIYVTQQTVPNADTWTSWGELNAGAISVTSAANADGRLEVFYVGTDGAVYYRYQLAVNSGSWSNEGTIPSNLNGQIAAAPNADGTIQFFAVGTDKNIYVTGQTAPSTDSWVTWGEINAGANSLAAAANADGRLQVFAIGNDGVLYYRYQSAPNSGSWSNEEHIAANLMR